MQSTGKRRGKARRPVGPAGADNTAGAGVGTTVAIIVPSDGKKEVSGRLTDLSDWGVGVETKTPLPVDKLVTVAGRFLSGPDVKTEKKLARIVHTRCAGERLYRSGLAFEGGTNASGNANGNAKRQAVPDLSLLDHYEILQMSPSADSDTIQRVYRLLAQRYHPDNTDTGNEEAFRAVLQAYRVLSDPEKRAVYDVEYRASRALRWRVFDEAGAASAADAEQRTRSGIVSLLYTQRLQQPNRAGVSIRELESLLACPREHLEFSLWYLKAKGMIQAEDNGRFSITADGVDDIQFSRPSPPEMQKALPPGPDDASE